MEGREEVGMTPNFLVCGLMSSEVLRYVNGKKVRFTGWSGILGSFGICLCNIYVYAKHWEHSSKENTVPDFMKLIFYWEYDQGSRQTITKETKL